MKVYFLQYLHSLKYVWKSNFLKVFSEVCLFKSLIFHENVHLIPWDRLDLEVRLFLLFHEPTWDAWNCGFRPWLSMCGEGDVFYNNTGQCEGEAVLHLEGGAHAGLGIPGGVFDSSSNKWYPNYKQANLKWVLALAFLLSTISLVLVFFLPATFKQPLCYFSLHQFTPPLVVGAFSPVLYPDNAHLLLLFFLFSHCLQGKVSNAVCLKSTGVGLPPCSLQLSAWVILLIMPGPESSPSDHLPRTRLDHHHLTQPGCASDVSCDPHSVYSSCCGQAFLSSLCCPSPRPL